MYYRKDTRRYDGTSRLFMHICVANPWCFVTFERLRVPIEMKGKRLARPDLSPSEAREVDRVCGDSRDRRDESGGSFKSRQVSSRRIDAARNRRFPISATI